MSQKMSTDVLIVGAGPTGLMLACQLALHPKISVRIIDKNIECTKDSRALVVHARSLELFAQLKIIDKVLTIGHFANAMNVFILGRHLLRLDFSSLRQEKFVLGTHYPYLFILEQAVTERLLEEFLNERGIKVERKLELTDIETNQNGDIQVTLNNDQIFQTKYLCACDGAHSIVRHKLHATFDGRTYSESLFVADCKLNYAPLDKSDMILYLASTGLCGMFPITNDRYRLVGTIHEEEKKTNHDLTINDMEQIFKERSRRNDIHIVDCKWMSVYRSHHRHVNSFVYENRYFLLGDAAHIHSPVGGQGMNTGLQDAHNLAWKLAFTLIYSGKKTLIESYHNERSVVAKTLVNTTDRAFAFLTNPHWFMKFCRLYIAPSFLRFIVQPLFNCSKTIQKFIFSRLSQLAITYRSPTIWDYGSSAGQFRSSTPAPGDRFPYAIFDPRQYHLLIFDNIQSKSFVQSITNKYSHLIQIHENITNEELPLQMEGAILIRPDGYVAYRTNTFDFGHFQSYFTQFFPQ